MLVEAVARLHHDDPSVELVLLGPYLGDEYRQELVGTAPGVTIHFLPMRTDVVTPLHAADVVVVPSSVRGAIRPDGHRGDDRPAGR